MSKSITTTTVDSDSVELSKDAKGQYRFTIKCYASDFVELMDKVDKIETALGKRYANE